MSTIYTYSDLDYIVYLNKDHRVIGYRITDDDLTAIAIKLRATLEFKESIIPEGTAFISEIINVSSLVTWEGGTGATPGKLISYKPKFNVEFAKEIYLDILKGQAPTVTPKKSTPLSSDFTDDRYASLYFLGFKHDDIVRLKETAKNRILQLKLKSTMVSIQSDGDILILLK